MKTAPRVRLDSLTSLRFLAALLVVFSHSTRDLVHVPVLSAVALNGGVGVGFFFALSGFVLTWSSRPGDSAARFYRRRFARVYPMQFLTYLLAFPILLLAGTNMAGSSITPEGAVTSPLLLQAWFPQRDIHYGMNAPSWSLSNEAFFYLLCPLLIPALKRLPELVARAAVFVIPMVVIVGAAILSAVFGDSLGDVLYLNPAWRLLGFAAGVLLAIWVQRGAPSPIPFKLALALTAAVYLGLIVIGHFAARLHAPFLASSGVSDGLMMPAFLLLIAAGATADIQGTDRWVAVRPLVALGEWSFALYLTHWLLIDLLIGLFPSLHTLSPLPALLANLLLVVLAVAVAVAAGFYRAVERPLERRLRGARPRPEELLAAHHGAPNGPAPASEST